MPLESWLPIHHELPDGARCSRPLYQGSGWQIISTVGDGRALIAKEELRQRWLRAGLIDAGSMVLCRFGAQRLHAVSSSAALSLAPVDDCRSPTHSSEALAFAMALQASRQIDPQVALQDSIYVERLGRLLPIYADDAEVEDTLVLGAWLSGGVRISALDPRLDAMLNWMSTAQLQDIIEASGVSMQRRVPALSLVPSGMPVSGRIVVPLSRVATASTVAASAPASVSASASASASSAPVVSTVSGAPEAAAVVVPADEMAFVATAIDAGADADAAADPNSGEVAKAAPTASAATASAPRPAPVERVGPVDVAPAMLPPFELPGRRALESFFNQRVVEVVRADTARGTPSAVGPLLLQGPAGSGKSHAIDRLVDHLGWPCLRIDASTLAGPYIQDASRKAVETFALAAQRAPSVLVLDHLDGLLAAGPEGEPWLLRMADAAPRQVLVIATTRLPARIDPALWRGRGAQVAIEPVDETEAVAALDKLLSSLPLASGVDTAVLAPPLAGRSLSDLAWVVRESARLSARAGRAEIEQSRLLEALRMATVDVGAGVAGAGVGQRVEIL